MKTKLIIISIVVLLILAAIATLLFLRGNEDNWICEKGEWIKHGNPKESKPETSCGSTSDKIIDQLENNIPSNQSNEENPALIGGERDEHGCLGPAGYSWCETKQKCLRTWEEECSAVEKEDAPAPVPVPKPLPLPDSDSTSNSTPTPNPKPAPAPSSSTPSTFPSDIPTPLPLP
jgi:hypothetical protein